MSIEPIPRAIDLEHADDASSKDLEVQNLHRDHDFSSGWHIACFVVLTTSSQLIMQAALVIFPLDSISAHLQLTHGQEAWPVAAFSLVVGAFVLPSGRLGDLYGKRNLLVFGWAWIAIWSVVSGVVDSALPFILSRAFMGLGPAALLPNSIGLLGQAFKPGPIKTMSFGIFSAFAPIGFIVGGLWGALCGQLSDYRWSFRSMAIITALMAVATPVIVPKELNTRQRDSSFDYLGSAVGVSSIILVFFSMTQGAVVGWHQPYVYTLLIVGALLIPAFVYIERRARYPVLPMSLFANRLFSAVALSLFGGWMSFGTYAYYLPLLQIRLRGLSYLGAVAQWIPVVFSGCLAVGVLAYTMPRVPAYVVFGGSMSAFTMGALLLSFQEIDQSYWALTFPAMVIICWGPEWSLASSSLIVSDAVPPEQQGVAGSFINTITNVSIGIGLALAGNIEVRVNKNGTDPLLGYKGAWWMSTGMATLGVLIVALVHKRMKGRASPH